jgi:hypothetical protein
MNYKTTLRIAIVSALFVFSTSEVSAQAVQKIGSNSFTINPKAVLELESTTKGFLPPRMTTTQQTAISLGSNEKGLIVYVTDALLPGLQTWDGIKWVAYADTTAMALKADATALTAEVSRATAAETAAILAASQDAKTKADAAQAEAIKAAALDATTKANLAKAEAIIAAALDAKTKADAAQAEAIKVAETDAAAKVLIETNRATAAEAKLTTDKEDTLNKSTSITLVSNSDIKFPTEKAVIDYVNVKTNIISIVKKTSSYTILDSDNTILCDTSGGTFKLTLPAVSGSSGKIYVIRKTDMSNNELTFDALTFSDGVTVTSLNYPKTLRVQSNGTAWYIID